MKFKKPEGRLPYIVGLVCAALVVLAAIIIPSYNADKKADAFAAPLFNHEMPDDARLIQATTTENDDGSTSATIILQSAWTQDEIADFYSDTDYAPAADGEVVTFSVLPVDADSLEVLKNADLYEEEGGEYWFVYLYSGQQE